MNKIIPMIITIMNKVGVNITRARNTLDYRRARILKDHKINLVLDVGANQGQYARTLVRRSKFKGEIISFEPLRHAHSVLEQNVIKGARHETFMLALGNYDGTAKVYVTRDQVSSSILLPNEKFVGICPGSFPVDEEEVFVAKLDSIRNMILKAEDRILLKIDTQGYETEVLLGSRETLGQVFVIELELSLIPLYLNQPSLIDSMRLLDELGFHLVWLERGLSDSKTGHLLQIDALFVREVLP